MLGEKYKLIFIMIGFCAFILMALDYMELMAVSFKTQEREDENLLLQKLDRQYKNLKVISQQLQNLNYNYSGLVLDLDEPNLTGPRTIPLDTSKSLVVMAIGRLDKERVNDLITNYFYSPSFSFLLFHYDNSTYHEYEWYNRLNVIAIRALHKMKWWYLKRFLTPNMAAAFSSIVILDADVAFPKDFDPLTYQRVADAYGLALSQPSHAIESSTSHLNLVVQEGEQMGRYTDFIECGPAVWLSSQGYQCIYDLLQVDLTSGWGLDILWVDYIRTHCALGNESVAVLDAFQLIHSVPSSEGTASSNPGFNDMALYEMIAYPERFPTIKINWGDTPETKFGNNKCKNHLEPKNCTIRDNDDTNGEK